MPDDVTHGDNRAFWMLYIEDAVPPLRGKYMRFSDAASAAKALVVSCPADLTVHILKCTVTVVGQLPPRQAPEVTIITRDESDPVGGSPGG